MLLVLRLYMFRAERQPETCRVVRPLKLELGASVGFMHKEFRITISVFVHSATRLRLLGQYLIITTLLSKYISPLPIVS
jgi:hypothetical protein